MKRRTFIETSIGAAAVFAARPSWAAASEHEIKKVGLQLYTVRKELKQDFDGTIAKVAATGYKEVEFAGDYDGHSPKEVRALLEAQFTSKVRFVNFDMFPYGIRICYCPFRVARSPV